MRDLKAHLSAVLDRAAAGETITVTERGRPKAVLGPVPGRGRIDRGIAEGWVNPGTGGRLDPVTPAAARRSVAEVLADDRSDSAGR